MIDVGQALGKRVAHPLPFSEGKRRADRRGRVVIKAPFPIHFLVILRKMHTLSGELAISICREKDAR